MKKKQCEGWRRNGGAFTLGPASWAQCKNTATFIITVKQDGKTQSFPACEECRNECVERKMELVGLKPIKSEKGNL